MRTLSRLLATAFIATTVIGCSAPSAQDGSEPVKSTDQAVQKGVCQGGQMWIPPGTKTFMQKDGSMGYQLPAGWDSIVEDGTGGYRMVAGGGGSVTCKCDKGSGDCSPVSDGGSIGCLIGSGCQTCTRSAKATAVNRLIGVEFAKADAWGSLPLATPAMLEVPELAKQFHGFLAVVATDAGVDVASLGATTLKSAVGTGDFSAPEGTVFVPVNAFGRLALITVPTAYAAARALGGTSSGGKCQCNAGSGCKYWSKWGYSGCEAGSCTSCTMFAAIRVGGEASETCR